MLRPGWLESRDDDSGIRHLGKYMFSADIYHHHQPDLQLGFMLAGGAIQLLGVSIFTAALPALLAAVDDHNLRDIVPDGPGLATPPAVSNTFHTSSPSSTTPSTSHCSTDPLTSSSRTVIPSLSAARCGDTGSFHAYTDHMNIKE
ncbi:hypothetical protein EJB05_09399 [Eragrostis curvula]|uniref:Uncharacterized protein n=1 Tax=Eragrostis curvula TaxID=38414 RepID=A0A5J9W2M0_9POAL|nr:hypothetical protein EJB05_09399 [Eragrostis curvula]